MSHHFRSAAVLGIAMALTAKAAFAQQPSPGGAQPPAAGQPAQQPSPQQPVQIRRIDPSQLPPGLQRPGMLPGARPGMPPGHPGMQRPGMPRPTSAHHAEPEEEGHAGHEECPGHGPHDPPPHPNWWRGLLMVNNELAESNSPINQLLFRYENKKDPCDPKNMPPPFLAMVINATILALLLYRFGKKPLAEALVKRKATIMSEIETATKLKESAEKRLSEYEEKFENLEETLEQMRVELSTQAEQEKKHILAEAEERRSRMRRDAEFRIEQERKAMRAELLAETAQSSVLAAEEILRKKTNSSDLDRMAEEYLRTIGHTLGTSKRHELQGASVEGGSR